MLINELAQWAMIIFLAVLGLGLIRQLGNFLVPKSELVSLDLGPEIGDRLGAPALRDDEARDFGDLIVQSRGDFGAVAVVDEDCPGCNALVERLEANGVPEQAPLLLIARETSEEHLARLRSIATRVMKDDGRLKAAGLTHSPFVLIVDSELRVLFKEVAPDVNYAVNKWRGDTDAVRAPALAHESDDTPPVLDLQKG